MNPTHLAILLMALGLATLFSCLVGGAAFLLSRWSGSPVPESVRRGATSFATALTLFSTVAALVLMALK